MSSKYIPYYTISEDREEIEIRITAKRINHNYYFAIPKSWQVADVAGVIIVTGMQPPKRDGESDDDL